MYYCCSKSQGLGPACMPHDDVESDEEILDELQAPPASTMVWPWCRRALEREKRLAFSKAHAKDNPCAYIYLDGCIIRSFDYRKFEWCLLSQPPAPFDNPQHSDSCHAFGAIRRSTASISTRWLQLLGTSSYQNSENYTLTQKRSETLIKRTWIATKIHISLPQENSVFPDFCPFATHLTGQPFGCNFAFLHFRRDTAKAKRSVRFPLFEDFDDSLIVIARNTRPLADIAIDSVAILVPLLAFLVQTFKKHLHERLVCKQAVIDAPGFRSAVRTVRKEHIERNRK